MSIYPGGAKYVGEFRDFKPHGFGTFVWQNGDKYYGEWKDGKSDGNGTKLWKSTPLALSWALNRYSDP